MSLADAATRFGLQCTQFLLSTVDWLGGSSWPDAKDWAATAVARHFTVNSAATQGAIATWGAYQGGALERGHVAQVVGFQDNGLPIVQEQNWGPNGQTYPDLRALTAAEAASAQYIQPPAGAAIPAPLPSSAVHDVNVAHYGVIDTATSKAAGSGPVAPPPGAPTDFVSGLVSGLFPQLGQAQQGAAELPALIVSGLSTALAGAVGFIGHAIATALGVAVEDVGAFAHNHVVPLAVAGVVTAALFA